MVSKVWKAMLFCYLVSCLSALAAAAGDSPQQTRSFLATCLKQEGYLGDYPHGQGLQRGMSAYLWDHRHWLINTDFHRSRDAEALICLLHAKGYPQFAEQLKNEHFRAWCELTVKQP